MLFGPPYWISDLLPVICIVFEQPIKTAPRTDLSRVVPPSYPGSSFPLTSGRKRTTVERSDLKSENSGLPVELRMPKPEINMASSETCPRSLMEKDKV